MKGILEQFKKERVMDFDKKLLSQFLVQITKKYVAKKLELTEEVVEKIVKEIGLKKIILQVTFSVNDFVKPLIRDLKLFDFGCNVYFEYCGNDFFKQRKKFPIGIWNIFFICKNNYIIIWDHDGKATIFKYKRLKASKI